MQEEEPREVIWEVIGGALDGARFYPCVPDCKCPEGECHADQYADG